VNRPLYPFTAIVGQERMRLALLLHAVDPALGGVLVRGPRGTAKSTAVRALAALLPEIACVADCPFGCDPADLAAACDGCAARIRAGEQLPVARRRVPVVDLPIGATEDRVVGSLDIEAAIGEGARRFEPGLLARANRGILYIDEVNLLGDHLVDLLLDAAAMGRNYVEREGVSVSHPARIMLIGTMNPEEGDLRPQLLDRFALAVEVEGLLDPALRVEAARNRLAFERDPHTFIAAHAAAESAERERLEHARALLPRVVLPDAIAELIAHLCAACGADGLRADLALHRAATALAAYRGHEIVSEEDVRAVAEMVLAHRRRRTPFEQPGMSAEEIDEAIARFKESHAAPPRDGGDNPAPPAQASTPAHGSPESAARLPASPTQNASTAPSPRAILGTPTTPPRLRVDAPGAPLALTLPAGRTRRAETAGRHDRAASGQRGGIAGTIPWHEGAELAPAATLRAAALYQRARRERQDERVADSRPALLVRREDLRAYRRQGRTGNLALFVVDASGSMGARRRMALAKGAVLGLLLDAYRKRDQTGLIAFRDRGAELILPPTNSVDLAQRCLADLPTGGRTPLAAALHLARATILRALRKPRPLRPLLILVSDGRANAAPQGLDPWQAARTAAAAIRAEGWPSVVIDTEERRSGAGLARQIAAWLGARYIHIDAEERLPAWSPA